MSAHDILIGSILLAASVYYVLLVSPSSSLESWGNCALMIVDASEFSLWSTGTTTAEMLISSPRTLDSTGSLTVQL